MLTIQKFQNFIFYIKFTILEYIWGWCMFRGLEMNMVENGEIENLS